MSQESAVQFDTKSRIHMGLPVRNLEASIEFYWTLFAQGPAKTRSRYAKFEIAEPPVNLSLNEVSGNTCPNNHVTHFGIQVKSTEEVTAVTTRLRAARIPTRVEENVTCCYAVQNKVWGADPDGNKWEVYVVLDNEGTQHQSSEAECCSQVGCCTESTYAHSSSKEPQATACCS
jgi:predicted lactoylglutathione lyase